MASKFKVSGSAEALVKRIMFLAWQASQVSGIGWLQDRGWQPEEVVWQAMYNRQDCPMDNIDGKNKPGEVYADYVFGRMMKLGIKWDEATISTSTGDFRSDYQSFCHQYRTFADLVEVAAAELKMEVEQV